MFASAYSNSSRGYGSKVPCRNDMGDDHPVRYNGSSRRPHSGAGNVKKGDSSQSQSNVSAKTLVQVALSVLFIGVLMCMITGFSVYFVLKARLDKHSGHEDVDVPRLIASLDKLEGEVKNNFQSNKARMNLIESELQNNISLVDKTLTEKYEKTMGMLGQAKTELTEKNKMTNDKLVETENELKRLYNMTNDKLAEVETEVNKTINTNSEFMEALTKQNETTNAKINQMEIEFQQNNSMTVAKIQKVEFDLQSGINEVNNSLADTQASISAQLNATKTNLTTVIQTIETTNQQLVQVETNLSAANEDLRNLSAKVWTTRQTVLFSAKYPPSNSASLNMAFVYETVVANVGGGYDNTSGIFTAPVEGTYIFAAQLCINTNKKIFVQIAANDTVLASATSSATGLGQACTTMVASAYVQVGEQVMVKCTHSCDATDLTLVSDFYANSFTGVLID